METAWHADYPGIILDSRTMDDAGKFQHPGIAAHIAFVSATKACLNRIAERPVGRDLLTLISKRCQGIGSGGRTLKCRIIFGEGTLTDLPGYVRDAIGERTFELPDLLSYPIGEVGALVQGNNRGVRRVRRGNESYEMMMAGKPVSVMLSYNPFINYDILMQAKLGVPMPAFIALAHELVHGLHRLSGDRIADDDPARARLIEEARTVGAGKYRATRISENAIRAENNLALRTFYDRAGDCNDP